MSSHCPLCNTKHTVAIGAVAYSEGVLVEHRCVRCGHIFYVHDRRDLTERFRMDRVGLSLSNAETN